MALHDFQTDLRESQRVAQSPWWKTVYSQAFPDFESMSAPVEDLIKQRRGIDRVITLHDGAQIFIDEKVRTKAWTDVLLEKWSSEERQIPGWIEKPLYCDYIAYAFLESQNCIFLPFQQLRRAWKKHEVEWTKRFGTRESRNRGYTTVCVPVPLEVVIMRCWDALWVSWRNEDGLPFD